MDVPLLPSWKLLEGEIDTFQNGPSFKKGKEERKKEEDLEESWSELVGLDLVW